MLSSFQERVARLFLGLPEADGYALAGGSALVVHGLIDRETKDLDFFVAVPTAVRPALEALVRAVKADGLDCQVLRSGPSFARLRISGSDGQAALVDLGYDWRLAPPVETRLGPALSSEELAADKLLALYGRAAARDFVDVYQLARVHGIDAILTWAGEKDRGLDLYHLAIAMDSIERHPRTEFAVDDPTLVRLKEFFADLRADLVERSLRGRSLRGQGDAADD